MAVIKGNTGSSYTMRDQGKAYPLTLDRKLKAGEYPVKIEFTTLTGSPNAYYKANNPSQSNSFTVYLCDSDGSKKTLLYTVDSERFKRTGTTTEAQYQSANVDGKALAGATLCLIGEGRSGCYLRNICQVTITTAGGAFDPDEDVSHPNADLYQELLPTVTQNDQLIDTARRATWRIKVKGVDITDLIKKSLISIEVKDNEEDEADDLQIKLADRDSDWLQKWLNETVQKGAKTKGLRFHVWIGVRDSTGRVIQQKAGNFCLDSMKHGGPPAVATIKCTSLDFAGGVRTDKHDKSWENYDIKGIAKEIAGKAKLKLLYLTTKNPKKERREQTDESDIAFLLRVLQSAGLAIKITDGKMAIFERGQFDSADAQRTVTFEDGSYIKWDCSTTSGDVTYDICTVRYTDPKTGKVIKGEYKTQAWYDEEEEEEPEHTELKIRNQKVASIAEANALAETSLNLKNTFERTVTLTFPGNPAMMSGLTLKLKKFGYWSGKYMMNEVTHSISNSGYTTKVKLRFIK